MPDRARETELIEAYRAGETDAFGQLVELYRQRAYSLAYRWLENREDALDVCQEAFLRMYRALGRWRPKSSIFTWLYRVIVNLSIDVRRKRAREKEVPLEGEGGELGQGVQIASSEVSPWHAADLKQLGLSIRQAAMLLPKRQQKAFVLRFYEGLAIRDIARVMRCSEGATKATLFHAVRRMRKILAPQWRKKEQEGYEVQRYKRSRQISRLR